MLALGADDNSISIWKNTRNAPLVVVKDIFERQILDLSW
jgi:protein HIRA/HIR1